MNGTDAAAFAAAYGLGSVPFAWILVRWFAREDLGASGSGNVGALNAMRVARSRVLGVAVLLLDALKGAAAVLLARAIGAQPGAGLLGVVAGHDYNLWLSLFTRRLVGGKGFAAAAGGLLCVMPWLVPLWLGTVLLAWFVLERWRGIRDEAPATAVATLGIPPLAGWIYDLQGAIVAAAMAALILPKLVREVRALLFERTPARPA